MSFISELKRRNVLRAGAAYLAFAWLAIEVSGTLLPLFEFDQSAVRIVVILFAIGFIPAMVASWKFEFTSEGIKSEHEVQYDSPDSRRRSKRLDRWVLLLLAVALAYFMFDKFVLARARSFASP